MELPIVGQTLMVESMGYTLDLGTDQDFLVQIESNLRVESGESNYSFVPAPEIEAAAEIIPILTGTIKSSSADSGTLTLTLESGTVLTVPPNDDIEAWNVVGPGGYRVVCTPGGELAVWSKR